MCSESATACFVISLSICVVCVCVCFSVSGGPEGL